MKNYYELLGISQTATEQEIKVAYRKLSQKFHPDKNEGDKFFEEMFKKIQEAYEILGNAAQRKNYDLQLAKNTNKQQTTAKNNFVPVIEIFTVNPPQVYSGEVITISWKVFNADKITINLIGEVEAQGENTVRLNNLNTIEFIEIQLTATNTHINKATEKIIRVENKTYLEIKDKLSKEMEDKVKREFNKEESKPQKIEIVKKKEDFDNETVVFFLLNFCAIVGTFAMIMAWINGQRISIRSSVMLILCIIVVSYQWWERIIKNKK